MIQKVKIYGERCSGTNFLMNLIHKNFDVDLLSSFEIDHKHFFGFQDLSSKKDTLFICIVRDPVTWINSFYRKKWHLPEELTISPYHFLNNEFYSYYDEAYDRRETFDKTLLGKEILEDRNIYTKRRYRNIFEMRHIKLKWMIETLPSQVQHYLFLRYEDIIDHFEETMYMISKKGLRIRNPSVFPENHTLYKNDSTVYVPNTQMTISKSQVLHHPFFQTFYERKLGYL